MQACTGVFHSDLLMLNSSIFVRIQQPAVDHCQTVKDRNRWISLLQELLMYLKKRFEN